MTFVRSLATISPLASDGSEVTMTEATTTTTVSRRSTRLWAEDDGEAREKDKMPPSVACEPRYGSSSSSDEDIEGSSSEMRPTPGSLESGVVSMMDLGIDLSQMFPASQEDISMQGMPSSAHLYSYT